MMKMMMQFVVKYMDMVFVIHLGKFFSYVCFYLITVYDGMI
jgi:hypothetical protein